MEKRTAPILLFCTIFFLFFTSRAFSDRTIEEQIGAFVVKDNAFKLLAQLNKEGKDAFIKEKMLKKRIYYAVVVRKHDSLDSNNETILSSKDTFSLSESEAIVQKKGFESNRHKPQVIYAVYEPKLKSHASDHSSFISETNGDRFYRDNENRAVTKYEIAQISQEEKSKGISNNVNELEYEPELEKGFFAGGVTGGIGNLSHKNSLGGTHKGNFKTAGLHFFGGDSIFFDLKILYDGWGHFNSEGLQWSGEINTQDKNKTEITKGEGELKVGVAVLNPKDKPFTIGPYVGFGGVQYTIKTGFGFSEAEETYDWWYTSFGIDYKHYFTNYLIFDLNASYLKAINPRVTLHNDIISRFNQPELSLSGGNGARIESAIGFRLGPIVLLSLYGWYDRWKFGASDKGYYDGHQISVPSFKTDSYGVALSLFLAGGGNKQPPREVWPGRRK